MRHILLIATAALLATAVHVHAKARHHVVRHHEETRQTPKIDLHADLNEASRRSIGSRQIGHSGRKHVLSHRRLHGHGRA